MLAVVTVVDDGGDARGPSGRKKNWCPFLVAKYHGIYNVFGQHLQQKHWYLCSFQHVARSHFSMQKSQNPVHYT